MRHIPHPNATLAMTPGLALAFGLLSLGDASVVTEFVRAGVTFMVSLIVRETGARARCEDDLGQTCAAEKSDGVNMDRRGG
jgi:hypothetical protein